MNKKIYLIVGASSEIGRAYIESLEHKGQESMVIATYNSSRESLDEMVKNLSKIKVDMVKCDLSKDSEVLKLINYIKEKYESPTNILHLAASKLEYVKFKNIHWNKVSNDLEIEVHSIVEILKSFLPIMSRKKYGKVVFMISSCTIGVPPKFMSGYVMAKYTLLGLMKSLASEYAGKGICINSVSPGAMDTRFWDNVDNRVIEIIASNSSMKRTVKKEEVTGAINFLMSKEADYINGVNLNISGGDEMI